MFYPSLSLTGNAEGLGGQRAGELAKSYDILGVPQDHIILFGHPFVHFAFYALGSNAY